MSDGMIGSKKEDGVAGEIPQRWLGSTGERISLIGLGGAHIARPGSSAQAVRLVRAAVDRDFHG